MDAAALLAAALIVLLAVLVYFKKTREALRSHTQTLRDRRLDAAVAQATARGKALDKRAKVIGKWTRDEVAKHAAADDLWLIIRDKRSGEARVYDMTAYVDEHPGGMAIMNNAGGDATEGFHGPQHPPTVFDLLDDFYVGTLVD